MPTKKVVAYHAMGKGDGDEKKAAVTITNQHRSDWNNYVKWLEQQGLKGDPRLDKGDYGKQVLAQYIKSNPNTSLTVDLVKPIQSDFANYRNYALGQVKAGKAMFGEGVNEGNFMQELSKLDAFPGSLTTKHSFPFDYMRYVDKSARTDTTVNRGFATMK